MLSLLIINNVLNFLVAIHNSVFWLVGVFTLTNERSMNKVISSIKRCREGWWQIRCTYQVRLTTWSGTSAEVWQAKCLKPFFPKKTLFFFFISALLALSAIVLQFCPHQSLNSSLPYFLSIYIISCFKYVPSSYCHELSVQASLIPYVKNLRQSWRLLYVTRSDQLYGVSNKIKIYKPTETHNYWNYWVARAVHSCQDARVT